MKKEYLIILIFLGLFITGCDYTSSNFYNYYKNHPELTPPVYSEIPKNELHKVNGIQYRIVTNDYMDNSNFEHDRYCPEFGFNITEGDGEDKNINALVANRDLLINGSLFQDDIKKQISFGSAITEKEAIQTAVNVIKKFYMNESHDCLKYEQPFYICYNVNANAWIISGTSDLMDMKIGGGAVCMAIEKDTGILLMLYHTL